MNHVIQINQNSVRLSSSDLTAADDDGVNCDQTEQVGAKLHKQLDKVCVIHASIKRSDYVPSLDLLHPGILVDRKEVHINPALLFSRLIAIVQREEDMSPFFDYELTTIPTSLFKDNGLRKTDKAQLAKGLKKKLWNTLHYVYEQSMLLTVVLFFIRLNGQRKEHTRV